MKENKEKGKLLKRQILDEYEYAEMKMILKEEELVSTFDKAQMVIYNQLLKQREIFCNKASRVYKSIFEIDSIKKH